LQTSFTLHAAGRTTIGAIDRKFDEVNQSIADVLAGKVPTRVVSSDNTQGEPA